MALKKITSYVDDRGDRVCPSCKKENIVLGVPFFKHNRTELHLSGFCSDCGCDFVFIYQPHLFDIETD